MESVENNYENTVCQECTSDDQGYDLKDGCEACDQVETPDRAERGAVVQWLGR